MPFVRAHVVFMGSPEFALPSLRALTDIAEVVGVVTQPDRPAGRGRSVRPPPVKQLAAQLELPVMQPERIRDPGVVGRIIGWNPEVIVVSAYGQILSLDLLDAPQYGCLNVHASLLPRWRGAAPIQAAILAGDTETGVTIMKMDEGLDSGPIVSQRAIAIGPDETGGSLTEALAELGARLLVETLPGYLEGKITPQPQPQEGVTLARAIQREDGMLDLHSDARTLARQVRAFYPRPGTRVSVDGRQLKVVSAHPVEGSVAVGERLVHEGNPALGTADGLLVLDEVQPPGKRQMTGRAYLAGARAWIAPHAT